MNEPPRRPHALHWYTVAWRNFWREPGVWLGFTLQLGLALLGIYLLGLGLLAGIVWGFRGALQDLPQPAGWVDWPLLQLIVSYGWLGIFALVLSFVVFPGMLQGGLPWLILRRLRHEEPLHLKQLLQASDGGIFAAAIYNTLFAVLLVLVAQLGIVYALLLNVPYSLGLYRMADGERNGFRAFRDGVKIFLQDPLGLVLFAGVSLLLQTSGLCTCGIGALLTVPMQMLAYGLLYEARLGSLQSTSAITTPDP